MSGNLERKKILLFAQEYTQHSRKQLLVTAGTNTECFDGWELLYLHRCLKGTCDIHIHILPFMLGWVQHTTCLIEHTDKSVLPESFFGYARTNYTGVG